MAISKIGTNSINQASNTVFCETSGSVGIGTSSPSYKLDVRSDGPVFFSATNGDGTRFGYTSTLPTNTGNCYVGWIPETVGTGGVNGDLALQPRTSAGANIRLFTGTTSASERMRIDSSGNLLVNTTALTYNEKFSVAAGGAGINTAMFRFTTTDDRDLMIMRHARGVNGSSAGMINFQNAAGTQIGSIYTVNGSSTVYGTSSDYRLKENIAPMTGALDIVGQLKPCTYTWKATGEASQGFIAHELQEVVPDCVVGEKDAVNEDGSIRPQGIDTSFLVATLTAAIQEQQALITQQASTISAMEARLSALESK